MTGWQWHQLNHMQTICYLFQKITTPAPHQSDFYGPDALPDTQPTASKHWKLSPFSLLLCPFIFSPRAEKKNKMLNTSEQQLSHTDEAQSGSAVSNNNLLICSRIHLHGAEKPKNSDMTFNLWAASQSCGSVDSTSDRQSSTLAMARWKSLDELDARPSACHTAWRRH